jgi:hypothetical protein
MPMVCRRLNESEPQICLSPVSISKFVEGFRYVGHLTVHSVYDHSINILLKDGSLLSITNHKFGCGPFSISIDLKDGFSFREIGLSSNCPVSFSDDSMQIGDKVRISGLSSAKLFYPSPTIYRQKFNEDRVSDNLSLFVRLIMNNRYTDKGLGQLVSLLTNQVTSADINRWTKFALPNVLSMLSAIDSMNFNKSVSSATSLVGLGPGSTPSGDDFLAGFMIGALSTPMQDLSKRKHLENVFNLVVQSAKGATTILGYEYMRYASLGMGSEFVIRTVESLINGAKFEVEKSGSKLLELGSSSGSDIAAGVVIGIMSTLDSR